MCVCVCLYIHILTPPHEHDAKQGHFFFVVRGLNGLESRVFLLPDQI